MTDIPQSVTHPSRRGFLGRAALVAATPAAAAILGPTLIPTSAAPADAASAGDLPSFPSRARDHGPHVTTARGTLLSAANPVTDQGRR